MKKCISLLAFPLLLSSLIWAQDNPITPIYPADPHPEQPSTPNQDAAPKQMNQETGQDMPVFRVNVFARTAKAVNYRHRGGSTMVDFRGTDLMPEVGGHAKVDGKAGRLAISAELTHLKPAVSLGGQYLTYVLWAITPEGRAVNLGEVLPSEGGKDKIDVTTDLQAFGMIVTAEPYYAVVRPSNEVVAENVLRPETKGFEEPIDAKFDVLEGSQYTIDVPVQQLPSFQAEASVPLDLLEARNAVAIAKAAGAQKYAPDSLAKAEDMLQRAESYLQRRQGRTPIGTAARGATQMAEDARVLTLRRQEQERLEAQHRAQQEAQAKAQADADAARQNAQDAQAQAAEDARRRAEAESAKLEAEQREAAALAAQQQAMAEADAARVAAENANRQSEEAQQQAAEAEQQRQQAEQARLQADQARRQADSARQQAEQEKEEMRARLLAQLNQVLQTKDTARGLIVSMPDVLFGFNKYDLKPEARERLARISGIVLAYPDLHLKIEGYTDSIGGDEYNQRLSEKRAASVRDYLVNSGVSINNVIAQGYGKSNPVADNGTASGRKLNRRVDLVVSGEVIGQQVGQPTSSITVIPQ